ncbi:hypothetical protein [Serratia rhizosphaerae]|uniref:DUF3742 family protein n=1 Tax=Serratia rhizosphaerae TaxID=2597702 RepID=A0ABX6GNX6_9GAMM|nr:hypothetical protein [Serratia rhizosphaerae]QHA87989.1 hypothetical protein FO014_14025 [Serratia rhizosphaerae]
MDDATQHHAYRRGVRMASRWKRLESTVLKWDRACVSKAQKVNIPKWAGHIPMIAFGIIILAALVFGGLFIASSAVLLGALILFVTGAVSSGETTLTSNNEEKTYHSWQQDSFSGREYNPHRYNEWKD